MTRTESESLNFGDMDEGRWNELWTEAPTTAGGLGWLRREVFGGLERESREAVELIIRKPQAMQLALNHSLPATISASECLARATVVITRSKV